MVLRSYRSRRVAKEKRAREYVRAGANQSHGETARWALSFPPRDGIHTWTGSGACTCVERDLVLYDFRVWKRPRCRDQIRGPRSRIVWPPCARAVTAAGCLDIVPDVVRWYGHGRAAVGALCARCFLVTRARGRQTVADDLLPWYSDLSPTLQSPNMCVQRTVSYV